MIAGHGPGNIARAGWFTNRGCVSPRLGGIGGMCICTSYGQYVIPGPPETLVWVREVCLLGANCAVAGQPFPPGQYIPGSTPFPPEVPGGVPQPVWFCGMGHWQ